jgi:hypothetical protein
VLQRHYGHIPSPRVSARHGNRWRRSRLRSRCRARGRRGVRGDGFGLHRSSHAGTGAPIYGRAEPDRQVQPVRHRRRGDRRPRSRIGTKHFGTISRRRSSCTASRRSSPSTIAIAAPPRSPMARRKSQPRRRKPRHTGRRSQNSASKSASVTRSSGCRPASWRLTARWRCSAEATGASAPAGCSGAMPNQEAGTDEINDADGEDDHPCPLAKSVVGHALDHERRQRGASDC